MSPFLKRALCLLPTALLAAAVSAEEAPESVTKIVPVLESWGQDPQLVQAVKAQNARGLSLEAIKKADADWMAASEVTAFMNGLLTSAVAEELKRLEGSEPYFTELFLMDDQGAIVAMTNRTSDYWQGDEAKFTESYKGGQGAVHVSDVDFDTSAQTYLVQVSVPVMDGGAAIGALTIGIDLDALEQSAP